MALKENTLLSFKKGDKGFDFDGCMTIAKNGLSLAVKISTNEVTPKDLHGFNQATQPFQTSKWLATLVAAIIGVASGMVIGFFAGGLPGMIAGAIVGGVTAVSCTMWHTRKKAPLVQISNQCKGIVNKADQPSDGAVMKPLASI